MCEEIAASQAAEIEQMQGWLLDWYGVEHEPQMKPGDQRMMEHLAELECEEFEIEFMEMMIRHHPRAIREAGIALRRAYHPELLALAESILETQSAEIAQMRTWLCDWYDLCRAPERTSPAQRSGFVR